MRNESTGDAAEDFDVQGAPAPVQASPPAPEAPAVAPQAAPQVLQQQQQADTVEPTTLVAALKALLEVENMPTRDASEEQLKQIALARARRTVGRLQQLPELHAAAHAEMGTAMVRMAQAAPGIRLEALAKSNMDVAALLKERDELKASCAALEAQIALAHS